VNHASVECPGKTQASEKHVFLPENGGKRRSEPVNLWALRAKGKAEREKTKNESLPSHPSKEYH